MDTQFELAELSAGPLSIGLAPALGGSLAYFRHGGVDLMRPLSQTDLEAGNVLGAAMFPMLPYANRIAGNPFDFGGRRWNFTPNNPPDPLTLHGSGWKSQWRRQREDGGVLLNRTAGRNGDLFGGHVLAPDQSLSGTIRFLPFFF